MDEIHKGSFRRICIIMLLVTALLAESAYIYLHRGKAFPSFDRKAAVPSHGIQDQQGGSLNVPSSRDYIIENVGRWCRFPEFFDESRKYYPLVASSSEYIHPTDWRAEYKDEIGLDDADEVVEVLKYADELRRKPSKERTITAPLKANSLTYVHIGKAGGSTVNCHLQAVQDYTSKHCDNYDSQNGFEPVPETAISRHVNCYTHLDSMLQCFYLQADENPPSHPSQKALQRYKKSAGNDYLINVRSPLDRIASWFIYEHTENLEATRPGYAYNCGQLVLNSCYRNFEDLTTVGLGGPKPPQSQPLKVGIDLTAEECSHWAWATIQGFVPADYHNAFNYDWYAHRMLRDSRSNQASIYALRVEHLEQDWKAVDILLGGDGFFPPALREPQNRAKSKPLRVADSSTTALGMENLCRALCEEIQVYKELLASSINLGPDDLEESMKELTKQCPLEVDLLQRACT